MGLLAGHHGLVSDCRLASGHIAGWFLLNKDLLAGILSRLGIAPVRSSKAGMVW